MSNKTTTNQELSKNEYLIALINDLNDQGILSQKWEERTKVKQNFKQYENILQKVESEQESILNLITKNDNCIASIRGTFGRLKKGTNYIKEEDYRNFLKGKLHNALIELSKTESLNWETYCGICKENFPTANPNNITNRLLVGLHPDKLLSMLRKLDTDDILKYIKAKGKRNWLEDNMVLYEAISKIIGNLENFKTKATEEDYKYFISSLGWPIAEYVRLDLSLLKYNKNLVLTGAPGTGKTYMAKQLAKRLVSEDIKDDDSIEDHIAFVQFHPSYDYTDFVEGLRAKKDETNGVYFEREDGIFKKFCKDALISIKEHFEYKDEDYDQAEIDLDYPETEDDRKNKILDIIESAPKYVFIIDEINRGEASKIFGELFYSIDPGYRGISGQVKTQYQNLVDLDTNDSFKGKGFFVPENVYIIGTMNDIDRSVESLDFAFRRRFAWKEVKVDDTLDSICNNIQYCDDIEDLKKRLKNLNDMIKKEAELGESFCIGASYLTKIDNYKNLTYKKALQKLWDYHLSGILFEYVRSLDETTRKKKMDGFKNAFVGKKEENK
ncbi:MAG: AAA family ATPase [Prevotella sp.]|jgi:hypothetical protein|nr:AAA family ATPase [Prevotella sp.]